MNEKLIEQITALKLSIEHWQRLATDTTQYGESIGESHCACCQLYFTKNCKGCPIAEHSESTCCKNTPYNDACVSFYYALKTQFFIAAQKELKYLQDILVKLESKLTAEETNQI